MGPGIVHVIGIMARESTMDKKKKIQGDPPVFYI
jgi:hypothetical protein